MNPTRAKVVSFYYSWAIISVFILLLTFSWVNILVIGCIVVLTLLHHFLFKWPTPRQLWYYWGGKAGLLAMELDDALSQKEVRE